MGAILLLWHTNMATMMSDGIDPYKGVTNLLPGQNTSKGTLGDFTRKRDN